MEITLESLTCPWREGKSFSYRNRVGFLPTRITNLPTRIESLPTQITNLPTRFGSLPTQIINLPTNPRSKPKDGEIGNDVNRQRCGHSISEEVRLLWKNT